MSARPQSLDWARDGAAWPNSRYSHFVAAAGLSWHVQQAGRGPGLVLLHGTGASTHSFRDMLAPLAEHFAVIVPDLPGHGFTRTGQDGRARVPDALLTLPGMARAVAELLAVLEVAPTLAVGHSAGAAVLVQQALDGLARPGRIVSINGALLPFRGAAGRLFAPLARLLAGNPLVSRFFAWRAVERGPVERLLWSTGSALDPDAVDLYARLFRSPDHVAATLGMMANWDLPTLERRLPALSVPLTLMAADNDRTVSPEDARRVARLIPGAQLEVISGLGHLAHEQNPHLIADRLIDLGAG